MNYRCCICGAEFDLIPSNAVQVGKAMGNRRLFRFSDGSVHELYSTATGAKKKLKKEVPVPKPIGIRTVAVYEEKQ